VRAAPHVERLPEPRARASCAGTALALARASDTQLEELAMNPMTRWDPARGLTTFQDQMSDLMRDFFGAGNGPKPLEFNPLVDVSESADAILVKAEVPGMDAKDIEVKVEGDTLTLRGEKKSEREEKGKSFHRMERTFGSFYRAFRLPIEIKSESVKAVCRNGVLEVTLPKAEAAKAREVKIDVKA
jgi:HSP20 family protein